MGPIDDPLGEPRRVERLSPPEGTPTVVVDTDAYNEIDDQFAVVYALGSSVITVDALYAAPFHNDRSSGPGDGMERSYAEIERLLDRLSDVPDPVGFVHKGSETYLPDAETPVESPAAADLVRRATATSDPLYVVSIGCPTNVASAILQEPSIVEEIVVVWLGGHPHDWPTAREFNLRQDRHASRILFESGVPLVQIPCKNVAEHVKSTLPELATHLEGGPEIGEYLYESVADYHGAGGDWWSKEIWDLAAVAWLVEEPAVPSHLASTPVLTDELTWSRDPRRHLMRVAHDVDRDRIFRGFHAALEAVA